MLPFVLQNGKEVQIRKMKRISETALGKNQKQMEKHSKHQK